MSEPVCPRCKTTLIWMMRKGQTIPKMGDAGYQCPDCSLFVAYPPSEQIREAMKQEEIEPRWWPARGYFTATPKQLERLITLGAKQERERIIKVVEGYLHHDYLTGQNEDEMLDELYLSELITLIKGEK